MQADNLRVPALIITILAWVVIVGSLISAVGQSVWLISYTQLADSPVMLMVAGAGSLVSNLAFWPSAILVLVWIHMAHANLHKAGLTGLTYSPAWATFSFLVPIVNLFVPFKAMRELANRSAGEPEELADADVDEVFSWWGCWIGAWVFGLFLIYNALIELVPGIWVTTPFWATQLLGILNLVLFAGSGFFLIKVVKLITGHQKEGANLVSAFE